METPESPKVCSLIDMNKRDIARCNKNITTVKEMSAENQAALKRLHSMIKQCDEIKATLNAMQNYDD